VIEIKIGPAWAIAKSDSCCRKIQAWGRLELLASVQGSGQIDAVSLLIRHGERSTHTQSLTPVRIYCFLQPASL
jgi:hypothetical protein